VKSEEEDGGNRRNQCEPVGAAGSAARQQHGPMGLTPNVSRLTQKETIYQGQMLLNV